MDTKEIKDTIVVAGPPKQKPNVEEVQDTIVVAWPPGHQPNDEDRAVAPRIIPAPPTTLASTGTSSKTLPQSTPKRALRRTCGFCRTYIGLNEVCPHRKQAKVVQQSGRSVVRVQKPINGRFSKQKAAAAAGEKSKTRRQ